MFKIRKKSPNRFEMIVYGAMRPEEMVGAKRHQEICDFEKAVDNLVVIGFERAEAYFMMLRLVAGPKTDLHLVHYRQSPVGEQLILVDAARGLLIQADEETLVYYLKKIGESPDAIERMVCTAIGRFPDPDQIGEARFVRLFGRAQLVKVSKAA